MEKETIYRILNVVWCVVFIVVDVVVVVDVELGFMRECDIIYVLSALSTQTLCTDNIDPIRMRVKHLVQSKWQIDLRVFDVHDAMACEAIFCVSGYSVYFFYFPLNAMRPIENDNIIFG